MSEPPTIKDNTRGRFGCTKMQAAFVENLLDGHPKPEAALLAGAAGRDTGALSRAASKMWGKPHVRQLYETRKREREGDVDPDIMNGEEILRELSKIARESPNHQARIRAMQILNEIRSESQGTFTREAYVYLREAGFLTDKALAYCESSVGSDPETATERRARVAAQYKNEASRVIREVKEHGSSREI